MTSEIAREILTSHARSKRNGVLPPHVTHEAKMINPRCGDQIELTFTIEGPRITATGFRATACAICTASASLVCENVKGQEVTDALAASRAFETSLAGSHELPWPPSLGSFAALAHVRRNPARLACAILPWLALRKALAPKA